MELCVVVQFLILNKRSAREMAAELDGAHGHEALSFTGEEMAPAVR
jgi:hypothetical protein